MSAAVGFLHDLTVIESSAFVAAPFAGMTLAQSGATVIRIDPIGGGLDYRRWPLGASGDSFYWAGLNKGKQSIQIDIRQGEGRALAQSLVTAPGEGRGLLLSNFPAVGYLDFERLQSRRADLIMINITGNHDGSSEVDYTVNPATGLPLMTGPADSDTPVNHVLPAWDLLCGLTAANSLITAHYRRRQTNAGGYFRVALSDTAFAAMAALGFVTEAEQCGTRPRYGNDLYGAFGRDFTTRDGRRLMLVAITNRQWRALVEVIGMADKAALIEKLYDVDLGQEGGRFEARDALGHLIGSWIGARDYADVTAQLDKAGVSYGPYRTLEQILEDPRCSPGNPMFHNIRQPGIGETLTPGAVVDWGDPALRVPRPAPVLGEHTDQILSEQLGLDSHQIGELHDRKIIAGAAG